MINGIARGAIARVELPPFDEQCEDSWLSGLERKYANEAPRYYVRQDYDADPTDCVGETRMVTICPVQDVLMENRHSTPSVLCKVPESWSTYGPETVKDNRRCCKRYPGGS